MTIAQQLFVSNVVTFPIVIPGTTTQPPVVTSVTPNAGPLAGNNSVTITGRICRELRRFRLAGTAR